ncbi:MAG: hypothetical protein HEQ10_17105 [Dolichospermum sp. DEX182a]|jgi:hypothetical protein|nr:hypothetical protein [Dolichospermum sp. DEX182a]
MLNEDLSIFFDVEGFAETATIGGATYPCIFDDSYSLMGIGSDGRQITACFKSSDIAQANVKHKTSLTIRCKSYTVKSVQPTGDGKLTDLELNEA